MTVSLLGWRQNIREVRPMAKSKYETHVLPKLDLVEAWARDGLVEKQIAHNLGVAVSTLNLYKKDHPEFSEALARGKEVVDLEVENAMLKRAKGYQYTEVTTEERLTRDGEIITLTKRVVRDVPPDPTSMMFWLANRRRDRWAYKPQPEAGTDEGEESGVVLLPEVDETLLGGGGDG